RERMPIETETDEDQQAYETERKGNDHAELAGGALSFNCGGESPLAEKIPDADAQMEGGSENSDGGEEEEIGVGEKLFDFGGGRSAVSEPALSIEMPGDVSEGDEAGVALGSVQPVPYPGVGGDIGFAAYPYIDAVTSVVEHRKKDEGPFDEGAERDSLKIR